MSCGYLVSPLWCGHHILWMLRELHSLFFYIRIAISPNAKVMAPSAISLESMFGHLPYLGWGTMNPWPTVLRLLTRKQWPGFQIASCQGCHRHYNDPPTWGMAGHWLPRTHKKPCPVTMPGSGLRSRILRSIIFYWRLTVKSRRDLHSSA